jgi:formylglycine-generating enzyme required for sulfatase activity
MMKQVRVEQKMESERDTVTSRGKEEREKLANEGNSIGMKFVLIPAGEFEMGSEEALTEQPVHRVKIPNPFYLGTYPVTQREWKAVMGTDPAYFKGEARPVESVSWNDVQEFIKNLNAREGTATYRLPTEAEWEYACRAGTATRYSFGESASNLNEYAWYSANSGSQTHPVGQKKPNHWGLHDMHGNVYEWVQDTWHSTYTGAPRDGSAWEGSGAVRVIRDGGWCSDAGNCRSTYRFGYDQSYRNFNLGFRLLRDV